VADRKLPLTNGDGGRSGDAEAGSRRTPVLVIILASYLMIVLDISIVITALPKIRDSLGFSATGLSWVQNAYPLAFGGLLLLGARAGDIRGRRRMFVAGLAVFTAAHWPWAWRSLRPGSGLPARRRGWVRRSWPRRRWLCCRRASRRDRSARGRLPTTALSPVSEPVSGWCPVVC
jgi:hypothetical protein